MEQTAPLSLLQSESSGFQLSKEQFWHMLLLLSFLWTSSLHGCLEHSKGSGPSAVPNAFKFSFFVGDISWWWAVSPVKMDLL